MKTVKQIALAAISLALLTSCGSNEPKQEEEVKPKKLVMLLYDISKSNDDYAILKEKHLEELFSKIAFSGGGKLYSCLIKSNSFEQELFEFTIPSFDTLGMIDNQYQLKKRRKHNAKILAPYEKLKTEFLNGAHTHIMKPKTEMFTDLKNALKLTMTTINQPFYRDWEKSVIIISDGINDLPPLNGEDTMEKVNLSCKVILVRSSTRTEYVTGSPLITITSINDALMNL